MNLKSLLKAKQQELEARLAEIDGLRDEVTTLEKAVAIAEKHGVDLSARESGSSRSKRGDRKKGVKKPVKPTLAEGILNAVHKLSLPYTAAKVKEYLESSLYENEKSIASTMRRLAEEEKLSIVRKGGPGKEAHYGPPPTNQELFPAKGGDRNVEA
jgi:23S rRNA G2445 N2-methylase RlmL